MVSKTRVTISEAFKREAIAFVNDLRRSKDATVTQNAWLEEIIPTLSQRDKRLIYEAYDAGHLSEGAAYVLIGDALYAVEDAIEEMRHDLETDAATLAESRPPVMADIAIN